MGGVRRRRSREATRGKTPRHRQHGRSARAVDERQWKATAHRVIVPNAECASKHRYSCAFFLDPDCDEIVATHPARLVALNEEAKYEPISSKAFVQMKIQEMQTAKQKGARGYT